MNSQGKRFSQDLNIDMSQYSSILFESFHGEGSNVATAIRDLERSIRPHPIMEDLKRYMGTVSCPIGGEPISSNAKKLSDLSGIHSR